jgi:hypothetical protein
MRAFSTQYFPGARSQHCIVFIPRLNVIALSGGFGITNDGQMGSLGDLWFFDLFTLRWSLEAGSSNAFANNLDAGTQMPGSRSGHAMIYHAESDRLYIFGGLGLSNNKEPQSLNCMWYYSLSSRTFTFVGGSQTAFSPTPWPSGRFSMACTYVSSSGEWYLFGGATNASTTLSSLWSYNMGTGLWTSYHEMENSSPSYGTIGSASTSTMYAFFLCFPRVTT